MTEKAKRGGQPGNKNAVGNPGGGHISKYKPEFDKQVYALCMLGLTDKEISSFLGVTERTFNNWKVENSSLFQSIRRGKTIADAKVAISLFRRAVGYQYEETTFESVVLDKNEDIAKKAFKKKTVKKELPPDVGAATMWLKNRQRDKWRDRDIDLNSLTNEQLDYIIDQLTKKNKAL